MKSNARIINSLLTFILFSSMSIAQIEYVEGYVIKNGKEEKVYIRDIDWSNNPETFNYKTSLDSDKIITGNISNVQGFGVGKIFKYVVADVLIDQSSSQVNQMTNYPEPNFVSDKVFLKQVIGGKAKLFSYQSNKFKRFFYQKGEGKIEPLVYKKYKINQSQISENLEYKLKLANDLKCSSLTTKDFRALKYETNSLKSLFTDYNLCDNGNLVSYERINNTQGYFNFAIKAGVFSLGLNVDEEGGGLGPDFRSVDMGTQTSLRIAVEVEYILPFNKNKWSIFLEPGYQSFSGTEDVDIDSQNQNLNQTLTVDYSYVDVPFGLRHYMYLNDRNKLFISAALSFTLDLSSSSFDYEGNLGVQDSNINSSANLVFGFGYNFNQKISLEARLNSARNITRDEAFLNSDFRSSGIILAYYF